MKNGTNILIWILAIVLQVLLFNRLSLYGLCHPQVYILCLLMLPITLRRELEMLIGFALGLVMDILCNTLGVHIAACVLVTFLRQPLLTSMVQNAERLTTEISMATIPMAAYIRYAVILIVVHQAMVSLLSAFSFHHLGWTFLQIIISSVLCIGIILGYNLLRGK